MLMKLLIEYLMIGAMMDICKQSGDYKDEEDS